MSEHCPKCDALDPGDCPGITMNAARAEEDGMTSERDVQAAAVLRQMIVESANVCTIKGCEHCKWLGFNLGRYESLNAARAEDRRDLSALLQEFLDQCDNQDCSLCERGRAALSAGSAAPPECNGVCLPTEDVHDPECPVHGGSAAPDGGG